MSPLFYNTDQLIDLDAINSDANEKWRSSRGACAVVRTRKRASPGKDAEQGPEYPVESPDLVPEKATRTVPAGQSRRVARTICLFIAGRIVPSLQELRGIRSRADATGAEETEKNRHSSLTAQICSLDSFLFLFFSFFRKLHRQRTTIVRYSRKRHPSLYLANGTQSSAVFVR